MAGEESENKWGLIIFIFGGILVALILFYESLNLFYDSENLSKYRSLFIDNISKNIVDYLIMLLNNAGVVR